MHLPGQKVVTFLTAFAVSVGWTSAARGETRDQYFHAIECASAFLQTALIFQAKKTLGERIDGKSITLKEIDFWESRSSALVDYLFNKSSFQTEAESDLSVQMNSFLAVFQGDADEATILEISSRSTRQAVACNKQYIDAGWFQ